MLQSDGQLQRRRNYDVRVAAQSFSSIATVLAGFAFTTIVLVIQLALTPEVELDDTALVYRAASSFLIAFFGCTIAAFTFGMVSGDEVLAPRSHAVALLGGASFGLSIIYMFWG